MSAVKTVINPPQAQKRTNITNAKRPSGIHTLKNGDGHMMNDGDARKKNYQQINNNLTVDEYREQPEIRFSRLRSSASRTAPRNAETRKERSESSDSRVMDTKSVSHRRNSSSTTSLPFIEDEDEHARNTPAKNAPDVGLPANFHPGRRGAIVSLDGPYNPLKLDKNRSLTPEMSDSLKPSISGSASLPALSHTKPEQKAVSKVDVRRSSAKTKAAKKSIDKIPSGGTQATIVAEKTPTQQQPDKNVYYVCYAPPTNLQEPYSKPLSTKSAPKESRKQQNEIHRATETTRTSPNKKKNIRSRETAEEGKISVFARSQSLPTSGDAGGGLFVQDANPEPLSFREIGRNKLQLEEEFLEVHPSETRKRHKFKVHLLNKKDEQHKPESLTTEEDVNPSHADGNMVVGKINIKREKNNDDINNKPTAASHLFVPFRNKDTFSFRQRRSHTAPIVPHQGGGRLVTSTIKPSSSSSFSRSPSASMSYQFDPDEFNRTSSATHRCDEGVKRGDSGNLSNARLRGLSPRKIAAMSVPPSINASSAGVSGPPTPSFSFFSEEALSSTTSRRVGVVADPSVVDLLHSESASIHPNYHCHRPHYHTARCGTIPIILECETKADFVAVADADATAGIDANKCHSAINHSEQKDREFSHDQSSRMGEEIIHLRTLEQNPLTPRGAVQSVHAIATVSPSFSRSSKAAGGTSRSSSQQGKRTDSTAAPTTHLSVLQKHLTLGSNASFSSDLLPLSLPRVGSLCILDQSTPRGRRELFLRKRSSSAVFHNETCENRRESLKKEEEAREFAIRRAVRTRIDRSLLPDMGFSSLPLTKVPDANRHLYHVGRALSLLQSQEAEEASQQAHAAQQQSENRWYNAESGGGSSGENPFAPKREASDSFNVFAEPSAQPPTAVQNQRNSSPRISQEEANNSNTTAGAQSNSNVHEINERSGQSGESTVNIHKIKDVKTPKQPLGPTRQTVGKSGIDKEPKAALKTQNHRKSPAQYKSLTLGIQKKIEEKIDSIKDREIDLQKRIMDFSQGLKL